MAEFWHPTGGARGDALADAGYDVVEAQPPLYEAALDVWGRLLSIDIRAQEPVLRQILGADAIRFLDFSSELYPPQDANNLTGEDHSVVAAARCSCSRR